MINIRLLRDPDGNQSTCVLQCVQLPPSQFAPPDIHLSPSTYSPFTQKTPCFEYNSK